MNRLILVKIKIHIKLKPRPKDLSLPVRTAHISVLTIVCNYDTQYSTEQF